MLVINNNKYNKNINTIMTLIYDEVIKKFCMRNIKTKWKSLKQKSMIMYKSCLKLIIHMQCNIFVCVSISW